MTAGEQRCLFLYLACYRCRRRNKNVLNRSWRRKIREKSCVTYKEYEQKSKDWTKEDRADVNKQMMDIFRESGEIRESDPGSPEAQALVKKLQDFITEKMYTCTNEILSGLGMMYSCGGDFTTNIDGAGGEGTAQFACDAIQIYCGK